MAKGRRMKGNEPRYNESRQRNETKQRKPKKKKKLGLFAKIVITLLIILILLAGIVFGFIFDKLNKMQKVDINEEEIGVSAEAEKALSKYRNIAIFGIDSRADSYSKGNRSDNIMIASINNETKEVRLISVYRDTYVDIEGYGLDKITHAYSYGEAPLALKTLNQNLDLNIKEFAAVNFDAVKKIIDALGGIQMKITSEEVSHIPGISAAGTHNLTGEQALAYSRIRYATGGDYKRTERMRDVLTAAANKAKTLNVSQLNSFVNKVLPEVYTNITAGDIFGMAPSATSYKITTSIGWPYETKGITLDRWYGVPVTLESNVIQLHKEIFNQQDYQLPDSIKATSDKIVQKTGYTK